MTRFEVFSNVGNTVAEACRKIDEEIDNFLSKNKRKEVYRKIVKTENMGSFYKCHKELAYES